MKHTVPRTPFSMSLSGSAKEAERRIRNLFLPKKRPPVLFLALVFAVCLFCGNLVSCQVAEAEQDPLPPNLTLAPVDWDNLSEPDPVYTLKESGNVLIEGLGDAYAEWSRSWTGNFLYFAGDIAFCCPSLAGRTAEGSVQWQDEPGGAVEVSISVNDDRLEDGDISGYYLSFLVDWAKKKVLESSFTSEMGDGTLELSEQEMLYAGRVLWHLMIDAEWTATAEVTVFPQHPDLNRNGVPEEIRLIVPASWGTGQRLEVWENGQRLYQAEGDQAHVGWNAVFLCTLDGEDYLLRYNPYMGQGLAGYNYKLFTLEGGTEKTVQKNELCFDVNFGMPTPDGGMVDPDDIFRPEEIAAFMDEINGLLAHSVQLLNTDQDLLRSFEIAGRLEDVCGFMYNEVFTPDPAKSLLDNLRDYRDTMVRHIGTARMG